MTSNSPRVRAGIVPARSESSSPSSNPECWIVEATEETDVGVLGRGLYHTDDGRANSHVTLVGDERTRSDAAVAAARASEHTCSRDH